MTASLLAPAGSGQSDMSRGSYLTQHLVLHVQFAFAGRFHNNKRLLLDILLWHLGLCGFHWLLKNLISVFSS